MNFTPIQWTLMSVAALNFIAGATVQLTDLFGAIIAKDIGSAATLLGGLIAAVLVPMTGTVAQIKAVAALPGVDRVVVNDQATQAVAAVAVDQSQTKVGGATAATQEALKTIAKGT